MGNVGSDYYEPEENASPQEEHKDLYIKTVTSGKESLDLFDYHWSEPACKTFRIKAGKSFYIMRRHEEVFLENVDVVDISKLRQTRILATVIFYK